MNDIEPGIPLGALDPVAEDPRYWDRFQAKVLAGVFPELARRAARPLTIPDVVMSWSRMIVPGAALAAAVAGVLLLADPGDSDLLPLMGIEEMLRTEGAVAEVPALLLGTDELDRESLLLAIEHAILDGGGQ
jgi:hypothetical protein